MIITLCWFSITYFELKLIVLDFFWFNSSRFSLKEMHRKSTKDSRKNYNHIAWQTMKTVLHFNEIIEVEN